MKAQTQRRLRQYHLYIGLFFAPMLLLFAVSGALQVFRLNEPKGYGGTPPEWMQWVASIHKNQSPPRAPKASAPDKPGEKAPDAAKAKAQGAKPAASLALRIFAVALALCLALSTLLGIAIAYAQKRGRSIATLLLVAGTLVPVLLLKM